MEEERPGPGWWLAADRKWYPPDLHPEFTGRWVVDADADADEEAADAEIRVEDDHGAAPDERRRSDTLLTIATVAVALASLAVFAALLVGRSEADDPATLLPPDELALSVHDLRVGMCIDIDPGVTAELTAVEPIECGASGSHEVVRVTTIGDDLVAFDQERIRELAEQACRDADDDRDLFVVQPSAQSWAEGDREVVCLAR